MYRYEVLAHDAHREQRQNNQPFDASPLAALGAGDDEVRHRLRQAGIRNGDRERAQHRIRKRGGGAIGDTRFKHLDQILEFQNGIGGAHARIREGGEDGVCRNVGHHAADEGADNQAENNVDARQRENKHQADGKDDGVHG